MKTRQAFTLIELLIVVAIIAILAAIAVPNFLEAQTRSKVSRSKADMRSMATGLESYQVDYNRYPRDWKALNARGYPGTIDHDVALQSLTTPVAYMTSIPNDPFTAKNNRDQDERRTFWYFRPLPDQNFPGTNTGVPGAYREAHRMGYNWFLESYGPSRTRRVPGSNNQYTMVDVVVGTTDLLVYDPTNGTISPGHIALTNKGFYSGEDYPN